MVVLSAACSGSTTRMPTSECVVEQLRVLDTRAKALQMHMAEGPVEEVQVEPVAVLGVAAVSRRRELARSAAVDRARVQAHPLADAAQRCQRSRLQLAAGVGADVEQQIAVLGDRVDEHLHQHVDRFPVQVVAIIAPTAVEGLAGFPEHRLAVDHHGTGWLVLLRRGEVAGNIEAIVDEDARLQARAPWPSASPNPSPRGPCPQTSPSRGRDRRSRTT